MDRKDWGLTLAGVAGLGVMLSVMLWGTWVAGVFLGLAASSGLLALRALGR